MLLFLGMSICSPMIAVNSDGHVVGEEIDNLWGISIYYNGHISNVSGRNITFDGYNLGLKYQCVEFVKRFYYEYYGHKMPNSYGHAKDFFDTEIEGGNGYNTKRGLIQYKNIGRVPPQEGDILIYGPQKGNPFGHVGIVAEVHADHIIIAQQNFGQKTRQKLKLKKYLDIYTVADYDILGWLRMP